MSECHWIRQQNIKASEIYFKEREQMLNKVCKVLNHKEFDFKQLYFMVVKDSECGFIVNVMNYVCVCLKRSDLRLIKVTLGS